MKKIFSAFFVMLFAITATAQQPAMRDSMRVLCIGNSFTYFYDSFQMLADIAASEGHYLDVTTAYVGGYTFGRHLHDLNTLRAIEGGPYQVVQLQDQSQMFARYGENPRRWRMAAVDTKELVERVRMYSPDAHIRLECTWSYEPFNCGGFGTLERYDAMMLKGTKALCRATKTELSPIGQAFAICRQERPDIDLYHEDRKHQSALGSYLKSCVNYQLIFHQPFGEHTACCNLDAEQCRYLQKLAERIANAK